MTDAKQKKMGLIDIVLFGVCTVLVVDTVAASAVAGPGGMVWWLVILVLFFLPYGLVTAELATTYPAEGGIYDWVKRAYGRNWAARTAWLYWVNYALWIPAVFYLFAVVIGQVLDVTLSPWEVAGIAIAMSWVSSWIGMQPVAEANWISTVGAIFKVIIMTTLGVGGIVMALRGEIANDFSLSAFTPSWQVGLGILPVILFSLLGFEVVSGASDAMANPKRDIPKATVLGGFLIAFFYLLAAFGVQAALPIDQISASAGLYESLTILFGTSGIAGVAIQVLSICFLFTLMANIVNWSVGVNYVAIYAARNGDMPASFVTTTAKGTPKGAALWNGVVATITMIAYALIATMGGNEDLFWNVFSLGAIILLMSYIIMFPAFLKLRRIDADRERPYRMPGGTTLTRLACYIPMLLLIMGVVTFFWVPGEPLDVEYLWQVGAGVGVSILIGEIFIQRKKPQMLDKAAELDTRSV
ncbi:APC family permease [Photobacterium sagamiensis]|uniref:APC family permease n=1 Tax=Photobacterium sagamiensis TaxID=2910241 RepID=UPI003D110FF7